MKHSRNNPDSYVRTIHVAISRMDFLRLKILSEMLGKSQADLVRSALRFMLDMEMGLVTPPSPRDMGGPADRDG